MYVCTYVRMCVCTYVRMYVCPYVRTYVRMYVCMYVCMYVRVYVCMCVSRRAVARVYVCALHRIWCRCGVQQLSRVMSFCVWGAAESHVGGRHLPPSPKGVTPAAARTILFSTSRCARAEKVPSTSALSFSHSVGSRRPGVSLPSRALHLLIKRQRG